MDPSERFSIEKLAIDGGKKAFPKKFQEQWMRPKNLEKEAIGKLIDTDELSGSGFGIGKEFEEAFKRYIGCKYVLSFSHGTAAIMAGYYALGVGPGDEVITPAVGYISSYAGAMHMGARPIFADIGEKDLLISAEEIYKKITPKTKAINIIHLNGRIACLEEILRISKETGIPLLEDASHALGGSWRGKKIGSFADEHITCFSLQGINPTGKPIASGEGGVACTNSLFLYQKMLAYAHLHRKGLKEDLAGSPFSSLDEEVLGLKWRAHPLAMALGLISLQSIDERNRKKSLSYQETAHLLEEFDFIKMPLISKETFMGGYFGGIKVIYEPSLFDDIPASVFVNALASEGAPITGPCVGYIEYRRHIMEKGYDLFGKGRGPLNGPWSGFEEYQGNSPEHFPVSEMMNGKVLTLPCFIDVDKEYYTYLKKAFIKIQTHKAELPFFFMHKKETEIR